MFRIRQFSDFSQLPSCYRRLVASQTGNDMFWDPDWFAFLMRRHFSHSDTFRLYGVEDIETGAPLLLAPLRWTTVDDAAPGARVIASISHPENLTTMALAVTPDADKRGEAMTALFSSLKCGGDGEPPCDALRLWPAEAGSRLERNMSSALRAGGFWVQSYANSYNRFEATEGLDYDGYVAARSPNHRYGIRRRQRALAKVGHTEFVVHTDPATLELAIQDYVAVTMGSWKSPPSMIALATLEFIELAARKGCLRLGVLRHDGVAAAAQFWIVNRGVGHCVRLAYREDHKHLAVGVVLTAYMIRHVLDRDHVNQLDFGFGNDDYKGSWMKHARYYQGFMAFNPSTKRGIRHGIKQILGRPVKRALKYLLTVSGLRRRGSDELV